jgi:hypothetical protein
LAHSLNTHAAPRLQSTVEIIFTSAAQQRAARADLDLNPSAAQSLRASRPHRPVPCRPYVRSGRMLEFHRADLIIRNVYSLKI